MGKVYLGNQEISPTVSVPVAKSKFGATIDTFIGNVDENGVLLQTNGSVSLVFDGVKNIGVNAGKYVFYGNMNIIGAAFQALTTISSSGACAHMFESCANLTSISFAALTTISGSSTCTHMFRDCANLTSISFPALTTVVASYACNYMFSGCTNITSVSLPALTTISGSNAFGSMFRDCANLTSISLPALTTISDSNACQQMFANCTKLTSISFPALTTINTSAFGTGSFTYAFYRCDALTEIHFRADAQATIEAMTGYADKWGATNATIYFSL